MDGIPRLLSCQKITSRDDNNCVCCLGNAIPKQLVLFPTTNKGLLQSSGCPPPEMDNQDASSPYHEYLSAYDQAGLEQDWLSELSEEWISNGSSEPSEG